jgi:transcription-repair coupling factor (superfamily II helicase)
LSQSLDLTLRAFRSSAAVESLARNLPGPGEERVLGGAVGSSGLGALATLHESLENRVLVSLSATPQEAASVETDLESLLGPGIALPFPQLESLPYEESDQLEVGGLRVEALEALFSGRCRLLVTTLRALQERGSVPASLAELRLTLATGDRPGFQELVGALEDRGFRRVPLVEEVGQLAVRGGILDVFSFGSPDPLRVEFWGDEIESLRTFDILDQRSVRPLDRAHILPMHFHDRQQGPEVKRSLLELLPDDALFFHFLPPGWDGDLERTWSQVRDIRRELLDQGLRPEPPENLFLPPESARSIIMGFPRVVVTRERTGGLDLETEPPPAVDRRMDRLHAFLVEGAARGHDTLILCDNDGQVQRLEEILSEKGLPPRTSLGVGSLGGGFLLNCSSPPLRVLTDHEIFRRSRRLRRRRQFRGAAALESMAQLTPGDYVVHMDHGVGIFRGLERLEIGGEEIESLAIEYAGGEVLRVPVYKVDLVERWVGESEDAAPPQIHRIGGRKWKTLKKKTEESIEAMTSGLLELYARRETAQGFSFSSDTRWQKEMESSFLYEDTPDQRKAANQVKKDMERAKPMDRLVCGDVGYGKTEVAIRAAFKGVQDGKQVAVLAPTTILVEQHHRTFEERLADYPVRVGALSRFRSGKELKALLLSVAQGETDIVIGTHRLLSPDVVFKDLGLLIVDEEQRFGVRHKERLKALRASVDVLTLTATPIPRTLYLSLAGIRDLSLIQTPPRDRMPIITHVIPWSDQILGEAVQRELDRGGQVFLVHNRVETIFTVADRIQRLEPGASVAVAHGQMPPRELDRAMRAFVTGAADILVCTSIIENGLDVPNANTLIVDGADRFGLAQLHQIRGRVGRSDRRAYCYLVVPPTVTDEADKRLRVLEHYTDLGSGYSVALRDLELRGAGNLLGADQSGFAHAVGLDTYLRLVEKTVERLRKGPDDVSFPEPEVALSASAFLPDAYISDSGQKLHLYRRLSRMQKPSEVTELRRELADRFGTVPPETEALLDATVLRLLGRKLGVDRIMLKGREGRISFRPGVVPNLARLDEPFRDRQVEVEVKRMDPFSLLLRQIGGEPLASTLREAFLVLSQAPEHASTASVGTGEG